MAKSIKRVTSTNVIEQDTVVRNLIELRMVEQKALHRQKVVLAGAAFIVCILVIGAFLWGNYTRSQADDPLLVLKQGGGKADENKESATDGKDIKDRATPEQGEQELSAPEVSKREAAQADHPLRVLGQGGGEADEGAAEIPAPTLDIVRVDGEGSVTVAGQAQPSAIVRIYIDKEVSAELSAGKDGKFAVLFFIPSSDTPRVLSIVEKRQDGEEVRSTESTIIAPFQIPKIAVAEETGDERNAETTEATDTTDTESTSEAPTLLTLNEDGALRLKKTERQTKPITIELIEYGDDDRVKISGRGTPGQRARGYLNDEFMQAITIGPDGIWALEGHKIPLGDHIFRLDTIADDGAVEMRAEAPFKRENPVAIAEAALGQKNWGDLSDVSAITIEPGNTLWEIARRKYGHGILYFKLFDANQEQIKDPDLIYPGQIFDLPE